MQIQNFVPHLVVEHFLRSTDVEQTNALKSYQANVYGIVGFIDISGFSAMADKLSTEFTVHSGKGAEVLSIALNEYFSK